MCKYRFCFLLSKSEDFCPWFYRITWDRNFEIFLNNKVERQHSCLLLDFNEIAPAVSLLGMILDMSLVRISLLWLRCICFKNFLKIKNIIKCFLKSAQMVRLSFSLKYTEINYITSLEIKYSCILVQTHPGNDEFFF